MGECRYLNFICIHFLCERFFSHVGGKYSTLEPALFFGELIAHSYFVFYTQNVSTQSLLVLNACMLSFITRSKGNKSNRTNWWKLVLEYIISERRSQYFDVECMKEFLGVFFYIWSQCWFVESILVLCPVFCISFSPSKVGTADGGLFLLAQITNNLWSMTPREKESTLSPTLCPESGMWNRKIGSFKK